LKKVGDEKERENEKEKGEAKVEENEEGEREEIPLGECHGQADHVKK
jgi:hypothetical protein